MIESETELDEATLALAVSAFEEVCCFQDGDKLDDGVAAAILSYKKAESQSSAAQRAEYAEAILLFVYEEGITEETWDALEEWHHIFKKSQPKSSDLGGSPPAAAKVRG